MVEYLCNYSVYDFSSNHDDSACSNCSTTLFDAIVYIGLIYMLGEWFDFWGRD